MFVPVQGATPADKLRAPRLSAMGPRPAPDSTRVGRRRTGTLRVPIAQENTSSGFCFGLDESSIKRLLPQG